MARQERAQSSPSLCSAKGEGAGDFSVVWSWDLTPYCPWSGAGEPEHLHQHLGITCFVLFSWERVWEWLTSTVLCQQWLIHCKGFILLSVPSPQPAFLTLTFYTLIPDYYPPFPPTLQSLAVCLKCLYIFFFCSWSCTGLSLFSVALLVFLCIIDRCPLKSSANSTSQCRSCTVVLSQNLSHHAETMFLMLMWCWMCSTKLEPKGKWPRNHSLWFTAL